MSRQGKPTGREKEERSRLLVFLLTYFCMSNYCKIWWLKMTTILLYSMNLWIRNSGSAQLGDSSVLPDIGRSRCAVIC